MKPVFQTPEGLTFAHFSTEASVGTFDPSALTVLKREVRGFPDGLSVEAAIIGESHFVRLTGALSFVELLACVDVHQYGFHPVHWSRDIAATPRLSYRLGTHRVMATLQLELADAARRQTLRDELFEGADLTLDQTFPGPAEPRTLVAVSVDPSGQVQIKTVHEYYTPDVGVRVVLSHTSLTERE